MVYATASPAETPSVTPVLKIALRLLYEELPNVYEFSTHKMFTTSRAPFPNRISHFKILAVP